MYQYASTPLTAKTNGFAPTSTAGIPTLTAIIHGFHRRRIASFPTDKNIAASRINAAVTSAASPKTIFCLCR